MFHDRWPWRRNADGRTVLDLVPRWLRLALGLPLVLFAAGCMMIWSVEHDPARWHVDPLAAARTGKPNDHLVAPEGLAAAPVDRAAAVFETEPQALLSRFDAIARAAPRTEVVAGSVAEGHVTYVQRSRIFGFPDYVSVRAVAVPGGAALAVWSRARFGYSDLGVNAARVEDWLGRL